MFKICTTLLQKIYFNVVGRFLFFPYFCIISQSILYVFLDIDWNPAIISPTELFATSFTLLAMLSREPKTQIAGATIVANARMPFHQLRLFYLISFASISQIICASRYFCLEQLRCIAALLNGALPLWFRKFHIVNHPRYASQIICSSFSLLASLGLSEYSLGCSSLS